MTKRVRARFPNTRGRKKSSQAMDNFCRARAPFSRSISGPLFCCVWTLCQRLSCDRANNQQFHFEYSPLNSDKIRTLIKGECPVSNLSSPQPYRRLGGWVGLSLRCQNGFEYFTPFTLKLCSVTTVAFNGPTPTILT